MNEYRTARVADLLADFRDLQLWISSAPTEPPIPEDYYTDGWTMLRQCAMDGQFILDCAADTQVPNPRGGEHEQRKAELKQCVSPWKGESAARDPDNLAASQRLRQSTTANGTIALQNTPGRFCPETPRTKDLLAAGCSTALGYSEGLDSARRAAKHEHPGGTTNL